MIMSLLKGGSPAKMTVCGGGGVAGEKMRTGGPW